TTIMNPGMFISDAIAPPSMTKPPRMPTAATAIPMIVARPTSCSRLALDRAQAGARAAGGAVDGPPVLDHSPDHLVIRFTDDPGVPVDKHDVGVRRALHALDELGVHVELAVVESSDTDHRGPPGTPFRLRRPLFGGTAEA